MIYYIFLVKEGRFVTESGAVIPRTSTSIRQCEALDLFDLPEVFHPALAILAAALNAPSDRAPPRTSTLEGVGLMDEWISTTDVYIEYEYYLKLKGE